MVLHSAARRSKRCVYAAYSLVLRYPKNSYHEKNKYQYLVWTSIPLSTIWTQDLPKHKQEYWLSSHSIVKFLQAWGGALWLPTWCPRLWRWRPCTEAGPCWATHQGSSPQPQTADRLSEQRWCAERSQSPTGESYLCSLDRHLKDTINKEIMRRKTKQSKQFIPFLSIMCNRSVLNTLKAFWQLHCFHQLLGDVIGIQTAELLLPK